MSPPPPPASNSHCAVGQGSSGYKEPWRSAGEKAMPGPPVRLPSPQQQPQYYGPMVPSHSPFSRSSKADQTPSFDQDNVPADFPDGPIREFARSQKSTGYTPQSSVKRTMEVPVPRAQPGSPVGVAIPPRPRPETAILQVRACLLACNLAAELRRLMLIALCFSLLLG